MPAQAEAQMQPCDKPGDEYFALAAGRSFPAGNAGAAAQGVRRLAGLDGFRAGACGLVAGRADA